MANVSYDSLKDLPRVITVFPLDSALLLPTGILPLNIFEPRYLNMIDDAMAGERIIGMIQTASGGERAHPALARIGCVGRISSFSETPDGRYLISLTGLCRFQVVREMHLQTPYRQVEADYAAFADDLVEREEPDDAVRDELFDALSAFLDARGMALDWKMAQEAPIDGLVNGLAMALPFDATEKQALLEAPDCDDRRSALITLLRFAAAGGFSGDPSGLQ